MARNTEVILRETIDDLGSVGDIVDVAPGYARNYLIPRGLAYVATDANKRLIVQERKRVDERQAELKKQAEAHAAALIGVELAFREAAGDEDQLYGSVSIGDIVAALSEQGHPVEARQVRLDQPIKALGSYEIEVRLHPEVVAQIQVVVEREG